MTMLNGARILLSRRDLNLNQDALAAAVGVSQAYISGIERDKITNPTLEVVEGLAAALGVSPAYLLGLSDNPLGREQVAGDDQVVLDVRSPEERRLVVDTVEELQSLSDEDQRLALGLIRQIRRSRDARIIGA
jgi:transcriptional regulator with XRE-family HTH domain